MHLLDVFHTPLTPLKRGILNGAVSKCISAYFLGTDYDTPSFYYQNFSNTPTNICNKFMFLSFKASSICPWRASVMLTFR